MGAAMTRNLTPYDTGDRLEPKIWVASTSAVTRDNGDDFGKVDFDDDTSETVATLWLEKRDGVYVICGTPHDSIMIDGGLLEELNGVSQGGTE